MDISMISEETESSESEKGNLTIDDCMREFNKEELLHGDNSYYCNRCKKHEDAIKQMEIFMLPRILVLHMKRFKKDNEL